MEKYWKDGIFGVVVGDALGVPVEFETREYCKAHPVTTMQGYGTFNLPRGSWSDDSSLTLASLDSIVSMGKVDFDDMSKRFINWLFNGDYTPFNETFDVGGATLNAIVRMAGGINATKAGGTGERDNGNGSLMRIMPVCLYAYEHEKEDRLSISECISLIFDASSLTHGHLRSRLACGFYFFMAREILMNKDNGKTLEACIRDGLAYGFSFFREDVRNLTELAYYGRLGDIDAFASLNESKISSSGYVVSTLEAAIWCLLNSGSYSEAVLKAVNLGEDTDTVGAVTGGLAGLYYGFEGIETEWVDCIQRRDWIIKML